MADIELVVTSRENNKAVGTVTWAAKNLTSVAVSGPHGDGALPNGTYTAKRTKLLDKNEEAYRDRSGASGLGHCWMQVFEDAYDRTELGLHPDGNVEGTEGCIGIKVADSKPWYDAFKSVNGQVTVEVKGL